MFEETIHIDLTLPRSWNQCTTEQLETIAACILKHTALADRYHPFDWMEVKSELFFLLTETEIVRIDTAEDDPEDTTYLCRLSKKESRPISGGTASPSPRSVLRRPWFCHGSKTPDFRLRPWQIQYWIDTQLKWLDDEKSTLLLFPYKQLIFTRRWQWNWPFLKKTFHAPAELLQDFTWQQYRHLQDYMSMYIDQQNALVKLLSRRHTPEQAAEQQAALKSTRDEFLYILFTPNSTSAREGVAEGRGRGSDIARQVNRISQVQWQVILLWWSGMMHYLKDHYPRCFRSTPTKKNPKNPPNPFDLYTSIIATIQDKSHIDEEKINNQTYTIVLEHLERIAKENEEIEKINHKHK